MDVNELISRIKAEEVIEEALVRAVCRKVQEIFVDQSNLEPIRAPINVVGDVHGQFYDVLHLINLAGDLPDHSYVFIGDFVDRGYNSLETIMLLFLLKIKHPERIFLLRGNHESRQISCVYGFYEQTNRKYGSTNIWKYFNETFDYLPLSAIIDNSIFCVHGGLSPSIHALDQIREIDRKCQIPTEGPFADLMWSDPQEIDSWVKGQRGAGWLFGEKIVNQFNQHNGLKLIARAHQLAQQGYVEWFENKNLATVWSAPNYCYRCNNLASYMSVDEHGEHDFHTFKADDKSKDSNHYRNVIPYFL